MKLLFNTKRSKYFGGTVNERLLLSSSNTVVEQEDRDQIMFIVGIYIDDYNKMINYVNEIQYLSGMASIHLQKFEDDNIHQTLEIVAIGD